MAEKKDPLRASIEELGRMNTMYSERAWEDWKPGDPPKLDHFMHGEPRPADGGLPDPSDND
jgi:hypothetical protein